MQKIRRYAEPVQELQKRCRSRFDAVYKPAPELAVVEKEVFPAVQGRRGNLKAPADLYYCPAMPEIGFEHLENEMYAVLAVRDQGVLQKGMGMAAGRTFHAENSHEQNHWFSVIKVDDIPFIAAVLFITALGFTGRAVIRIKRWERTLRISKE